MHRQHEQDLLQICQLQFEKMFGSSSETESSLEMLGSEEVIVVKNHVKKAFYAIDAQNSLIKVIDLIEPA